MKQASPVAFNILAAGQAKRVDLYDITLPGGQTLSFTTGQFPTVVNNRLYNTGLIIMRGTHKQSVGLAVESMPLIITPQADSAGAPVQVAGYGFLEACKRRVLDGARVLFSKMFLADFNDTSPGATPWFQGRVNKVTVDRFSATIAINSDLEMLNVQAPVNVYQPGCLHTLFDGGCGLSAAAFQVAGAVTNSDVLVVATNLTQADDYFTLGRIKFTSGVLAGLSRTVKHYQQSSGVFSIPYPLPNPPQPGDTIVALPGCDKTTATCTNKFNNARRIRNYPFIPVPEVLYDGGTVQTARKDFGAQGGAKSGSPFGGGAGEPGIFKP